MKRPLLWFLALLILLGGAGAIWWRGAAKPVPVAAIRSGPAVELVYATGFVETDAPASIAARINAPIARVLVREGDRVGAGQALVLLDNQEQRAGQSQAAANRLAAAQSEGRILSLFKSGWVTRAARDQAVAAADAARAAEGAARARSDQYILRAAAPGTVLKRDAEPGDLAMPGKALLLIGDPARTRITAAIDERDIPRVAIGQRVLMSSDAWPGRTIQGHVRELTPYGDPDQRVFRARISPDPGAKLPLGLTLELNIVTQRRDHVLLAPATAIDAGHVWTIVDGRARRRAVVTGIVGTDAVEIRSGLRLGEQILTDYQGIAEGDRIKARRP